MFDCEVLLIGCGPTGAVLANLLGALGVRVLVLERALDVFAVPRATHIDEETVRNFQATGLWPMLARHCRPFGDVEIVDEKGTLLFSDTVRDVGNPHGIKASYMFDQPAFERVLREGFKRYEGVRLLLGCEVRTLRQEEAHVVVECDVEGQRRVFRAAWVVGCDGGQSFTREALGVAMASLCREREWFIVDSLLKDPEDGHFLPSNFRYVLEPERLKLFASGFGANRRWEFLLKRGEEAPSEEVVRRWVGMFIPPERLEFTRMAAYTHRALLAQRWRVGRVFLAGDAAHMMPPFAGQGMCSGIRDALNLAWKLHWVLTRRATESLLDTYEEERMPHARKVIKGTLFLGRSLVADGPVSRWWRSVMMRLMGAYPRFSQAVRDWQVAHPPLRKGFLHSKHLGGTFLPQGKGKGEARSDEVIGYACGLLCRGQEGSAQVVQWAHSQGVGVWLLGEEREEGPWSSIRRWMEREGLDFALVRPDRRLFAAGLWECWSDVQAQFAYWIQERWAADETSEASAVRAS